MMYIGTTVYMFALFAWWTWKYLINDGNIEAKKNNVSSSSILLFGSLVLSLTTVFLYCAGTANYGGLVYTLGLDPDALEKNLQQILYHGFLDTFPESMALFTVYVSYRFIYFYILVPIVKSDSKLSIKFIKIKDKLLKYKRLFKNKKYDGTITKRLSSLVFMLFLAFGILVYSEYKGKKEATTYISKINGKTKIEANEMITVMIANKERTLFKLMCGAKNCAAIDLETKIVYYFPQTNFSYRMKTDLKSKYSK